MHTVTFNDVAHINDVDSLTVTEPYPGRIGVITDAPAKVALATYYMAEAIAAPAYYEAYPDIANVMTELVADEHRATDDGDTIVYWPDTVALGD
ncbi:hypothetical protein [Nocardia terpenica]|uniref:Uncharacterized protein n=1 Tax=Nocardia terpenica TaxID=455432 RepID=A0A291RCQ1_9NOCA|nr:hypothetical protein [Nocardia terpenica]ATL65100.1 hypothetical protein CRH09_01510 [Nocardia terpenica]